MNFISEKHDLLYDTKRASVGGYRRIGTVDIKKTVVKIPKDVSVDKIYENTVSNGINYIGKLDKNIYSCVTKDIITDEVIITDERIQHIKDHHPNDYEKYNEYIKSAIETPDYILEANKPNTAFVLKTIKKDNINFEMILRIVTSADNQSYKNSVITFLKVSDKKIKKYLRNKKILYKSE